MLKRADKSDGGHGLGGMIFGDSATEEQLRGMGDHGFRGTVYGGKEMEVPVIYIRFLQLICLLPHQCKVVLVHVEGENYQNPLLLEHRSDTIVDFEFELEDAMITLTENGTAQMVFVNLSDLASLKR